jgi:hypothetical protein
MLRLLLDALLAGQQEEARHGQEVLLRAPCHERWLVGYLNWQPHTQNTLTAVFLSG